MPTQPELEAVPCCDGVLFVTLLSVDFPSPSTGILGAARGGNGSSSGGAAGLLPTGVSDY